MGDAIFALFVFAVALGIFGAFLLGIVYGWMWIWRHFEKTNDGRWP